jgi:hypothetical protein
MSRKSTMAILAGGVVVIAGGLIVALTSSDGQGSGTADAGPSPHWTVPDPNDPAEKCAVTVMNLHTQTVQAVEGGADGLDPNDVMVQYGANSDVFSTWNVTNGLLKSEIYQKGVGYTGLLTDVLPRVRQMCDAYPRND